ncbi:response regulator transcription factor [Cecembia rubra]|uniref:LuxR family two component transcriptional regulator n=1 Tax=Cecembia rubra TaxID=1485585 RepID=A0A2P8EDE6_9BACT|nr:response regulator transcription factor [Cecembia rubra]PSL07454.1 LuxR family two component transcriptional regulator [Cecembia rubra]
MTAKKVGLIHIDDHMIFLQGLRSMLKENQKINYLGNTGNLNDGWKLFLEKKPELVLLDYFLPDGKGLNLAQKMIEKRPEVKIIFLTMEDHPDLIEICKSFGIMGFLPKTIDKNELFLAIDEVLLGRPYIPSRKTLKKGPISNSEDEKLSILSSREKQIAYLITEGYTSQEISKKLFLSQFTVNTHRRNVLQKLGLNNTAQLAALMAKNKT